MARVPLDPARSTGPLTRAMLAVSRRKYGADLEPVLALAHRPPLLRAWSIFELQNERLGSVLPGRLADLVVFVSAARIGCSWCVDFGAAHWEQGGLDPDVLRDAAHWRDSSRFDEATRCALEYAEQVCGEVGQIDDDLVERVRGHFGDHGLVEITYWAAVENLRSRFNAALGLSSQGFSSGEACALASASGRTASRGSG